jgi:hypothetical protein
MRFKSTLFVLLLVSAFVLVSAFSLVSPAFATTDCGSGNTITMGEYWLNNNLWGASSGSGSQCIWNTSQNGSTIAWGTSWNWTGQSNSVKSYDSSVLGWQWGWKIPNTGLPVQLASRTSVQSSWSFNLKQTTANTLDISYDTWLSPNANLGNSNPSDEVMIWLYRGGGAGPVGTRQATVTIDGTSWDLYEGNIGWEVHSFVRTSNTTSSSLNLMDFYSQLVSMGHISSSDYLLSVQSGTEIFTGSGELDTTAYSTTIGTGGGGSTPTSTPTNGGGGGSTGVLRGSGSNRCLDVPGVATANGTLLDIWDCNGGSNQQWTLLSNGELQVYGNKCLDVPNNATTAGTKVEIWDCNDGANQQWTLNSNGTVVGRGSGLCLDVVGAGTANGTAVDIWTCNGGSNQQWARQ